MSEPVSESLVPATPPLSETQRVVDTFTAPSKTFTDILRKATFWGPLLIMIVVSILFSFSVQQKVGWEKVFENNIHQNPKQEAKFAQMPPDQFANVKSVSVKVTQIISYAYTVPLLIITAIIALLIWATVNFGFGGTAKYSHVYAVYMYSNLVMNIKFILAAVALFAGLAPDSFLQQNPVGTNIGYYLNPESPKWLITLCSHIDIFEIWALVLCVIGISIVAKVKRGTAAIVVVGWQVLIILIFVGMAAANS